MMRKSRVGVAVSWIAIGVGLSFFLNVGGDCAPDVQDCGQTMRLISFVILGLSLLCAALALSKRPNDK